MKRHCLAGTFWSNFAHFTALNEDRIIHVYHWHMTLFITESGSYCLKYFVTFVLFQFSVIWTLFGAVKACYNKCFNVIKWVCSFYEPNNIVGCLTYSALDKGGGHFDCITFTSISNFLQNRSMKKQKFKNLNLFEYMIRKNYLKNQK